MTVKSKWWILLAAVVLLAAGVARLRFDAEVLDLLPDDLPSVRGLKLYQQHFTKSRELLLTVSATNGASAETATQAVAHALRAQTNLVGDVISQAPWLEHPELAAELIAHLWLNQPPEEFAKLASRLDPTNLASVLAATRTQLATTMSPADIAQSGYDPFGFTRLPESVMNAASGFGKGQEIFSSANGQFHLMFVEARTDLNDYRECTDWLAAIKDVAEHALAASGNTNAISLGFTGRPAFVAEISASMKRDMIVSMGGTSVIIAVLFWLAHQRLKPMLWLLILLALILAGTLAMGGLIYGTVSVVSLGFAGILLGLAVDYAVVHYQEALAQPQLSIPQIRSEIAPSIFWAAITTITAFLTLNFGGLPGLAQLGTLVGVGVGISAMVMIYAFLPPLFPQRRVRSSVDSSIALDQKKSAPLNPARALVVLLVTCAIILIGGISLIHGLPNMDPTANALQPRDSQAYATLDLIKAHLSPDQEPLWLVVPGRDEAEVSARLNAVQPALDIAVSNNILKSYTLPTMLWPQTDFQNANRSKAERLVVERPNFHSAAATGGFTDEAVGLTDKVLDVWQHALSSTNVFWPTNILSQFVFGKLSARTTNGLFAAGYLYPAKKLAGLDAEKINSLGTELARTGAWLSGWELLGGQLLNVVRHNLWKMILPMVVLVLLSLWLAFRRFTEMFFSLAILGLSGLLLLAVMKRLDWLWNLLNLMAVPLILGTGVDYSIFMQLALWRYHGDLRMAHRSVGRALLLCGGTAVSGFGTLAMSSNAGMSSLGKVCALGIGGNMLISVFLLPVWWKATAGRLAKSDPPSTTSLLYGTRWWSLGHAMARIIPHGIIRALAPVVARVYVILAWHRREIIIRNLLPVLNGDRRAARREAFAMYHEFSLKLAELWHFENGGQPGDRFKDWHGWENFAAANERGKGVLLVTPHLGNWEFGGAFMAQRQVELIVLTQPEPEASLTELRRVSRARWGIETIVVGEDAFAFVEIIKRLQAGATVALLVDRPPPAKAVTIELFGRPFHASLAAAELARATGAAILPCYIIRQERGYLAQIMPEIPYDRAELGNREVRIRLTQEILRAFEPAIRQHPSQWFHFVPVWPETSHKQ